MITIEINTNISSIKANQISSNKLLHDLYRLYFLKDLSVIKAI